MVIRKILIDLRQFWPYEMCLLKRYLPQFSKSWYIFKRIEFKLKVSLEEISSIIPENWIYIKGVSWKDTFHVAKNQICIKSVSWRDSFHNLTNLNVS